MMSSNALLKVAVAVLIVLNLGLMLTMILNRPQSPPDKLDNLIKPSSFEDRLGFDNEQKAAFEVSRTTHLNAMQRLKPLLTDASIAYYTAEGSTELLDSLFDIADRYNDSIYLVNREHFDDLRRICSPEQLDKLPGFIEMMSSNRQGPPRRGDRPPRDQRPR